MTEARKAVTPISAEILREALQFPDDVQVIGEEDGNVHMLVSSERIPEGADAVLAVWVKKGETVEFLKFDPINMPAFIQPAIAERRGDLSGLALDLDAIPKDGTHVLVKRVVFRYNSQKGYYEPCGEKWEECFCSRDGYWQPYEGDSHGHPLNTTDTFNAEIIKEWRPLP